MDKVTEDETAPATEGATEAGINDNKLPPALAPQEGELAEVTPDALAPDGVISVPIEAPPVRELASDSLAGAPVEQFKPPKQDLTDEEPAEVV